ncbi:hypothetical protein Tco_0369234 [Tanacetum coccineum]
MSLDRVHKLIKPPGSLLKFHMFSPQILIAAFLLDTYRRLPSGNKAAVDRVEPLFYKSDDAQLRSRQSEPEDIASEICKNDYSA